jgi:hypothetical protein
VLWNRNDLLWFRFDFEKDFVPVPDHDNIYQFSKNKKIFPVSEAAYFPESWSHFYILTFLLYFMFDPDSNLDPEPYALHFRFR